MAIRGWNALSRWWGQKDNSPGLPMQIPPAPPPGQLVEVVVTTPPAAASEEMAPASFVIDVGPAALHQLSPKLQERATVPPVLPTYHTGEARVQGGFLTGSPATYRANRRSGAQMTLKEPSEQECLDKLKQLEIDPPSGLRDAGKAYYKIMLVKNTPNSGHAKSRLLEAREHLISAEKLTRENTLCPLQLRESWSQKIRENQTLLGQVAKELNISLDPDPSPAALAPSSAQLPEKSSPNRFVISNLVVGIVGLLGVILVTGGAIYGSRLWRKIKL